MSTPPDQITWTTVGREHFGAVGDVLTYTITSSRELIPYGGHHVIKKVGSLDAVDQLKAFAELHLRDARARSGHDAS